MRDLESTKYLPTLFVDLDGTLIKTDLIVETLLILLKKNIFTIFQVPLWLLGGKASFKHKIAQRIKIDPALLPYNKKFLSFLAEESTKGRELILASGSNEILVQQVANYLGIFTDVLASDAKTNMVGTVKARAILEICRNREFDYAGNALVDVSIWSHCRESILVNPHRGVTTALRKITIPKKIFEDRGASPFPYLRAIRFHQWLKNLLLFVPLATSHKWTDKLAVYNLIIGFFAFNFCASGGYLFNDFIDLQSDRNHPNKCNRPLASGDVSFIVAGNLMVLLFVAGLSISAYLSIKFLFVLLIYLAFSMTYSIYIKNIVLLDALFLAGLYTLRVIAGAIAIDVYISFWLLAFSMFIFLSLALVKRCTELIILSKMNKLETKGRDYNVQDLYYLNAMGISSGYLSVLVIALYINSNEVTLHYTHPKVLWILCPILLYWISRIWLKSGRGEMNDDPLVFTMRDRISWLVWILCAVSIFFAI